MEVSAFTHTGGGIALTEIMYSEEGGKTVYHIFHCFHGLKHDVFTVPSAEPEASLSERMGATSLHLEWVDPSLEELRGFLESYVVVFEELNTYQCLDLDPQTSQTRIVREPEIVITGLLPGKEYCVEIAAKTSAGAGNFTKITIPRELFCRWNLCHSTVIFLYCLITNASLVALVVLLGAHYYCGVLWVCIPPREVLKKELSSM